jgi:hypothetical protein
MKLFRVQDVLQTLSDLLQNSEITQSDYDKLYYKLATLEQLDEHDSVKASSSWIHGAGDNIFCDYCGYCPGTVQQASTYCANCGRIMMFDQLF